MSETLPEFSESDQKMHHPWYRSTWLLVVAILLVVGLWILVAALPGIRSVGPSRTDREARRRVLVTKAILRELHSAVNQFHMENGRWPTQAEGLSVLVNRPANVTNWPPGGYLEIPEIPKDGWGRDFIFEASPTSGGPFTIRSLGADGAEGGEGYDADLSSADSD